MSLSCVYVYSVSRRFFTQAKLNCSAFIMCPDIILESYYVTGSDNNGVFLPYYCLQYALYGQAVYTDLRGYCGRNLQWPTLITLYVRPDLQWPYIVGLTDQSWGKKTEKKKRTLPCWTLSWYHAARACASREIPVGRLWLFDWMCQFPLHPDIHQSRNLSLYCRLNYDESFINSSKYLVKVNEGSLTCESSRALS